MRFLFCGVLWPFTKALLAIVAFYAVAIFGIPALIGLTAAMWLAGITGGLCVLTLVVLSIAGAWEEYTRKVKGGGNG